MLGDNIAIEMFDAEHRKLCLNEFPDLLNEAYLEAYDALRSELSRRAHAG
mgnify:CR=1 FL=1